MVSIAFNRDTSKDKTIYTVPPSIYTNVETLSNGVVLYDNSGVRTNYVVSNINNSSFDLGTVVALKFTLGSNITSMTLNNSTYNRGQYVNIPTGTYTLTFATNGGNDTYAIANGNMPLGASGTNTIEMVVTNNCARFPVPYNHTQQLNSVNFSWVGGANIK